MKQLAGKVTIITGAGTGIGKGIARAFAGEGAHLVLASRKAERLEKTRAEIEPQGVKVLVVPTDVTDEAQVRRLFEATLNAFGRVDILINNAGRFEGDEPPHPPNNARQATSAPPASGERFMVP